MHCQVLWVFCGAQQIERVADHCSTQCDRPRCPNGNANFSSKAWKIRLDSKQFGSATCIRSVAKKTMAIVKIILNGNFSK